MRQPTKEEIRAVDFAHADAAIASAEHDLYVLELRRDHGVLGAATQLDPAALDDVARSKLSGLEATAKTRGVEVQLAIVKLRKACEASKDALLIDGQWLSPLTKRPYESDG